MSTYRERREARAERLRGWADKRETRGSAALDRAHEMQSVIPFGQPILVGHYSERRDRNYRARIDSTMGRGVENLNKAESMRSRADNIEAQAAGAIYSDDPDAIDALEARIATLEADRVQIKAENAAFRKAHGTELRAMTAYQRDQAMPHQGYELTNLSGNIKRNRDRLEGLRIDRRRAERCENAGGLAIEPAGDGYVCVTFSEKPAQDVRDALKGAGFTWRRGSWWGKADAVPEVVSC